MNIPPQIIKFNNMIFDKFSNDIGNMLIVTTILGWIASSTAQIIGISRNSKYSKEQKRFMIRQEMGDAAMNIGSFFLITKPIKLFASKLVSCGKIIPHIVQNTAIKNGDLKNLGKLHFNLSEQPYLGSDVKKAYNSFNNFMGTSSAVLGGILSSNLVTPILRNRYASKRQDKPLIYRTTISKQSPFYKIKTNNMTI